MTRSHAVRAHVRRSPPRYSSDLSIEEMTGMIELLFEYGARHGVRWSEPVQEAA